MLELPLSEIVTDHISAFMSYVNHLISRKIRPLSEQIKLEEFGSSLNENLTIVAYCQKEMKEKQETINQIANVSKKLDSIGNNIHHLRNDLQQIDKEEAELLTRLGQFREERRSLLAQKELTNHELAGINYDEQGTKLIVSMARTDFLKYQEKFRVINVKWDDFSKMFKELKPMPFQLAEAGGKPSLENHESLFKKAKNQQAYWKEVFYESSLITTHLHGFKSALPLIRLWMKTSTATHYDPFWVDYEVHHEKVVKLHNKVLDLNHSNWDLPPNLSKTLLKKYQNWLRKKNHKRANLLAKAEKSVMAMRPLVDKKIKMDAEEMTRDKEHEFLTYAWEKFHVFVTWSFPHYFEIVRIDANGNPIAPINA
ncbi:hypothetical protein RHSIM_Rhsim01G0063400 [Rhododendron simsii]|uniref:Uncharacterized protein n=1 Tax=Rhododendron simsii TaxID=118357 RepID=A0A834HE58_RHOSS|nr:hypothetical protein RHSIM_Rhsim01G0063400 [Rhododendron simsii]